MVYHWLKGKVRITVKKEVSPVRSQESAAGTAQPYSTLTLGRSSRNTGAGVVLPEIVEPATTPQMSTGKVEANYITIAPKLPDTLPIRRKPLLISKPLPDTPVAETPSSRKANKSNMEAVELPASTVETSTAARQARNRRASTMIYELPVTPEKHGRRPRDSRRASISMGESIRYSSQSRTPANEYQDALDEIPEVKLDDFPIPNTATRGSTSRSCSDPVAGASRSPSTHRRRTATLPADCAFPRTPGPCPPRSEQDSVSPVTPQSSGPVTPSISGTLFNRPRSYERLRPAIDLTYADEDIQIEEPEVYDEGQHSPEDFYDLKISPVQRKPPSMEWKPRTPGSISPLLRKPDCPGISTLKPGMAENGPFHTDRRNNLHGARGPLRAPRFSLQAALPQIRTELPMFRPTTPLELSPFDAADPTELPGSRLPETVPELEPRTPKPYASCSSWTTESIPETNQQTPKIKIPTIHEDDTLQVPSTRHHRRSHSAHSEAKPRRRRSHRRSSHSEASSPITATTPDRRSSRLTTYRYTPTQDSRADRRSYNTVRILDSGGERHERLRRVLGI